MESCSNYAYIKKSAYNPVHRGVVDYEIKEEDWEVNSDELNQSLDSDNEDSKEIGIGM